VVGAGDGVVGEEEARARFMRVLGRVMSEGSSVASVLGTRGREDGWSSESSAGVGAVSVLATSRSRAKRRGEALRAFCAASGVR
jgi:hypothetical protein